MKNEVYTKYFTLPSVAYILKLNLLPLVSVAYILKLNLLPLVSVAYILRELLIVNYISGSSVL